MLSQPEAFSLPGYSALREPHLTLDFLAKHHLFPALQSVVNQAVDKLSGSRCRNGYPLFPSEWEPSTEPNLETCKEAIPIEGEEEPYDSLPTTASSYRMARKKSSRSKGRGKLKECGSPVPSAQGVTKFRLQVMPTEETKVRSPQPRQEAPDQGPKEQRQPMFASEPLSSSQRGQPWRRLHLTLPAPGIKVEVPSQACLTHVAAPLASPCPLSSHQIPPSTISPCSRHSPPWKEASPRHSLHCHHRQHPHGWDSGG